MAVLWLMLYTAVSSKVLEEYRAGAAVGMTMAMQARKSREQEALLTVALNFWVLYLKPPTKKQHPAAIPGLNQIAGRGSAMGITKCFEHEEEHHHTASATASVTAHVQSFSNIVNGTSNNSRYTTTTAAAANATSATQHASYLAPAASWIIWSQQGMKPPQCTGP